MSDVALDLDALLDGAVLGAALATGRDPRLAARQFGAAAVAGAASDEPAAKIRGTNANRWSAADDAYLRQWSGVEGLDELAALLGRTPMAIETRQTMLGLFRPGTHPDYITCRRMALALGVDEHSIADLIRRGLLPAEPAPLDQLVWRTRRTAFYAWATNPRNWVYFIRSVREPSRIADEKLRRLILRRAAVWGDEWWSIGEAAEYHGVIHQEVNRYIRLGRLPAVKWGNWWVLRSEATRSGFRIFRATDGRLRCFGTPTGDAFLVLATAAGLPSAHVARMMGDVRAVSSVYYRYLNIVAKGRVSWLARLYGLPLQTWDDGATWWADWREAAHRFPVLERCWARLGDEAWRPNRFERGLLVGVINAFLRYHRLGERLAGQGDVRVAALREGKLLYEATLPRREGGT